MPTAGRVALVTGAGRGIGRAIAIRLATAGYQVALTARHESELLDTAAHCPTRTMVAPADLTSPDAAEDLFTTIESELGRVDVLIANAGAGVSAPLAATTDDQWRQMLDINLTAPFRCIRRAVPAMVAAGYGRIVVIASTAAKRGEPYVAAYTAAKHGVLGLVRSAAAELANTGVTVNAICPAYVDTPMTDQTVAHIARTTGRTPERSREILERKQPIGRLIQVDEVVDAVWFTLSNPAITGQGINVDGGAVQA